MTGDTPPTKADIDQAFANAFPVALAAPLPATAVPVVATPPAAQPRSLAARTLDVPMRTLELLGRPVEAVMGGVAGTIQGGPLAGLRRAGRALVDDSVHEGASTIIREVAPEFAKAHPYLTGAAGFVGDVVFDPLNLVTAGTGGFVRRGLVSGAKALGGEGAAKAATNVVTAGGLTSELGERYTQGAQKFFRGARAGASQIPGVRAFVAPEAALANLVSTNPAWKDVTAEDIFRLQGSGSRTAAEATKDVVGPIVKNLSSEDRTLLQFALDDPTDIARLQAIQADPALSTAYQSIIGLRQQAIAANVSRGLQPETQPLSASALTAHILNPWKRAKTSVPPAAQNALAILRKTPSNLEKTAIGNNDTYLQALDDLLQNPSAAIDPSIKPLNQVLIRDTAAQLRNAADVMGPHLPDALRTGQAVKVTPTLMRDLMGNILPQVEWRVPASMDPLVYLPPNTSKPPGIFRMFAPSTKELVTKPTDETLETLAKRGQKPLTDVGMVTQRNLAATEYAAGKLELFRNLAEAFGTKSPKSLGTPSGFRALDDDLVRTLPIGLRNDFAMLSLPDNLATELERWHQRQTNTVEMEGLIRRTHKLFKAVTTSLNIPLYPTKNHVGNSAAMYTAGMDVPNILSGQAQALRVLAGKGEFSKLGSLRHADQMAHMEKYSIIGGPSGFASEFRGAEGGLTPAAKALTGQKWSPVNPDNPAYEFIRTTQQRYIEDTSKVAYWRWEVQQNLSRGLSPDLAMRRATLSTKDILFDYDELSDIEKKVFRQIMPFYTFTRKNITLQIENALMRPGKTGNVKEFIELVQAPDDERVPQSQLKPYQRTGGQVQLPKALMKTTQGQPVIARLPIPFFDLSKVDPTNVEGSLREFANMVSPIYRTPAEYLLGQTASGTPIESRSGFVKPSLPGELAYRAGVGRALGVYPQGGSRPPQQRDTTRYFSGQVPLPFQSVLRLGSLPGEPEDLPLMSELLGLGTGTTLSPLTRKGRKDARDQSRREATAIRRRERSIKRRTR